MKRVAVATVLMVFDRQHRDGDPARDLVHTLSRLFDLLPSATASNAIPADADAPGPPLVIHRSIHVDNVPVANVEAYRRAHGCPTFKTAPHTAAPVSAPILAPGTTDPPAGPPAAARESVAVARVTLTFDRPRPQPDPDREITTPIDELVDLLKTADPNGPPVPPTDAPDSAGATGNPLLRERSTATTDARLPATAWRPLAPAAGTADEIGETAPLTENELRVRAAAAAKPKFDEVTGLLTWSPWLMNQIRSPEGRLAAPSAVVVVHVGGFTGRQLSLEIVNLLRETFPPYATMFRIVHAFYVCIPGAGVDSAESLARRFQLRLSDGVLMSYAREPVLAWIGVAGFDRHLSITIGNATAATDQARQRGLGDPVAIWSGRAGS